MAGREPLGRAFANIFTANLASSLGDGIAKTAAPLLAIRLTTDPLLISGIAALALLPWLLFAIPSGMLVDRIDRRRALALANGARTVLAVVLVVLFATGSLTIWWLYLIVFLYGVGETIYDGAIRAVVPSVVSRMQLPRANGRIEAGELIVQGFTAGPVTAALFAVSALIPLGLNGAAYALAVVLALFLPVIASGRDPVQKDSVPGGSVQKTVVDEGGIGRQFTSGLRFIRSNRMLMTLWLVSTFTGLCSSIAVSVFPLYAIDGLGLPEALFGIFLLSGAVGGLLGSLLADRLKAVWGSGLTMAVMNVLAALAFVLAGAVRELWALGLAFFLSSVAVIIWNVLVISLRQAVIPKRLLGRVHGTWRTLLWGVMPLGSLVGGLLGRIDLTIPFLVGGGASLLSGIVFFRFLTTLPNPEDVVNVEDDEPVEPTPDPESATPIDPLVQD